MNEPTPRAIVLADGRTLSRYEFGDPDGSPVLFLPGSASSGLAGRALDAAAQDAGIRLISLDRPGLGHSDRAGGRKLVDWPDDVAQLLDSLDLEGVALLGHSAGGAFALAVAHRLRFSVTATVIFAGSGPYAEDWFRSAAHMSRTSRTYYSLAARSPRMFGAMLKSGTPTSANGVERTLSLISRGSSPDAEYARTNPDETRAALEATVDGLRQGVDGATDEARMISGAWGFAVEDVTAHIEWWHGEQDSNVNPAAGRAMVERLPDATGHFVPGGHSLLFAQAPEVLASLRA